LLLAAAMVVAKPQGRKDMQWPAPSY